MSSPERFSDNKYKNWLKCSLALIVMKEDLHEHVHKQVQTLHNYLISKVSPLICGASTTVHCGVCTWKDIKYDKHNKLWKMKCSKNICNVWLGEIIAEHKTPNNPQINWQNCDISQWPSDPYQVAKAFMPKGQANLTKLPEDLDPPAILSLLYYCLFLCKNVLNTQILHDLIDVRNSLFHSGNFCVEDLEKDTCINNMLQLLQDLKLNGTKIEKIKREDIDISFRETEIKVLEALVSTLNSDLNEKINSVEYCQKGVEETMGKLQDCFSESTVKVVTMETKMESFEKNFIPVKTFFDNNRDISDYDIINKIKNIEETMSKHHDYIESLKTKQESSSAEQTSIGSRAEGVEDLCREVSGCRVDKCNRNKISEEKSMKSTDQILGDKRQQPFHQDGMPAAWDFTMEEIDRAWVHMEGVLVEDLAPSYILSSLTFLSANECQAIGQMESRGEMAKVLLRRVKEQLPDAFCILLNTLKEKGPEQLVEKLIKIIKGTCILNYAPKSNMSSLTMKLNVKERDGTIVSKTEIEIAGSINRVSSVFSENCQFLVTDVIVSSVIIHLQPRSEHAQATLAFFCKHGGIKDLVLNLLRKKDIYDSLPVGEVWIEVEVCRHEEDEVSKDAGEPWRDFASESFDVVSTDHVIKENLRLQYGRLLDEIEPLHLKKAFTDKGILDKCFLELKDLERRRERAAYFLDKLLATGNDEALVTLVDALKESGRENLATNLVSKRSPYLNDTDDVDEGLIQVVKVSQKHAEGSILWSCCLKVNVENKDDEEVLCLKSCLEGTECNSKTDADAGMKDVRTQKHEIEPLKRHENLFIGLGEEKPISKVSWTEKLEIVKLQNMWNMLGRNTRIETMMTSSESYIRIFESSLDDIKYQSNIRGGDVDRRKIDPENSETRFQTTDQNIEVLYLKSCLEGTECNSKTDADAGMKDVRTQKHEIEPVKRHENMFIGLGEEKPISKVSWTEKLEIVKLQNMWNMLGRNTRIETMMTSSEISEQRVNRMKLSQRIGQMRGRIERHTSDNKDLHVRTRAFDHARDILFKHKHIVLQGKFGEGKTYLALSLAADLIDKNKELQPVQIHNANEWEEIIDTKLPLVVLLDDPLGKYELSETDLDRWKKNVELIHPNLTSSSFFLIICIRTQIALSIKSPLRRNEALSFMFNSHVVDISDEKHCLTKEEKVQMLMKYAPQCTDRANTIAIGDILEMKNTIGFPQNCKILRSRQYLAVDLKEVFSDSMFLVQEIQELSKTYPKIYTFLVLLMLSGGHLSLENNMKEINNKIKTVSDYCGLEYNIDEIKAVGQNLCSTLVEYKKETKKFNFQHDCIEIAVLISFVRDYLDVTLRLCSLKQLSKMCCVIPGLDRPDGEDFLNFKIMIDDTHFGVVHERFKEGLESEEVESFKNVAEALVWNDRRFVGYFSKTITSTDDVLNFLSKTDSKGHSLLIHLIHAKRTVVVKTIIENIVQCCVQDHDYVKKQLLLATTNACLAEEKDMLEYLIKFQEKVDDFVMFAAALTGNVSLMEMLVLQKGNINAELSISNRKGLVNVIQNCERKTSSSHDEINLFHIACIFGRTEMVKYLKSRCQDLVLKTNSLVRTFTHFLVIAENVELLKCLSTELNPERKNSDGETLLHIAALLSSIRMVNYLITTNPSLIKTTDKNGCTAAHNAAIGGNVHVMQALLDAGLDITAPNNNGIHVLHIAAINDNMPMVKYLNKTSPRLLKEPDSNGWTALHCAAGKGSVPMMMTLIDAGMDITARTNNGAHVLHLAASNDNLTVVKYLIETNPQLLQQPNNNGLTVLHYAAGTGSVPMMMTLIDAGMDITARTNNGAHVLHIAAINDNLSLVKYLIETNPQLLQQPDNNGWTVLHCAAGTGSVPMMMTLIAAGMDITARTNNGDNILHIAASNDNLTVVKYLIETNPQLLQQPDHNGWTVLHSAAGTGSVPMMMTLIAAGMDITARTNNGDNILHIAANNDNLTVVKYLIETNPQLLQQPNNNGRTVLHSAAGKGSVPVMMTLVDAGVDITARTNSGAHVLHIAAGNDNLTVVKYLIETNPQLLQQPNNNGLTVLHCAAGKGSVPMMMTLIDAGVDITARTNDGAHVLHIAANNDNLTVVKYLIETNPQLLQVPDNNGLTVLHCAAGKGSVPMMMTLIAAGMDITARTNNGAHVLHIAANNDNLTLVKYLIETNPQLLQQPDNNGWTVLHCAAGTGSVPMMMTLIAAGMDITARTNNGAHVLHIAASNDNLTVVKYLIETNSQLLQQPNNNGWTVLHSAAGKGSVPMMMALIAAGMDITARTNDGAHVLHIAANNDNLTLVKYLIETNPQLLQQPDNNGWTVLHCAAGKGSVPMMMTLIDAGVDITARTNNGANVLHIAASNDNLTVVKYLIETNPQLLQQPYNNGWTVLHSAAGKGSVPMMMTLIAAGMDITARTNNGDNILHIAASNDNLTVVKYLIETNPQLLQQPDNDRWTVLHSAAGTGSVSVMMTLIDAGMDITARTKTGAQVLHIAAGNDNLTVVKYLIEINPQLLQQPNNYGWTVLLCAAGKGSVPMMMTLIAAGMDITARTNNGAHVLHIAAINDNLSLVKYLIETNPQLLQQPDNNGWTVLHCAAGKGSVPMMMTLIAAGMDITARTNNGAHVLHIAASNDNLTVVKYLIETNPQLLQQPDNNGLTVLLCAAGAGSVPMMMTLIAAGMDITARTNDGDNILHIAASNDNLTVVKYLIETNPQLLQQPDNNGWTVLHSNAGTGSVSMMMTLIDAGMDITARTNNGAHVLHIAASNDNLTVVKYLIETNPQLLQQPDNNGWTVLHCAAGKGSVPMMMTLIAAGMDITARTNNGDNILHIAASNDNLTVVKHLIETNPQLLQEPDNNGWTVLHSAAGKGSVPMMMTLIDAGMDITARTDNGAHVLHIAASNDNLTVVKYLIETNPQLLQQPDNNGWTVLHSAAGKGSVPMMMTLIAAGMDITARTNNGDNILHIAANNDNLTVIKYLIETNPQLLQQPDNNGWTVLHCAAGKGSVPMMMTLIAAGMDITARASNGAHVLHIAASNDNLTVVKYLIETNPQLLQQPDNNGWTVLHCAAGKGSVPMMMTLIAAGMEITARTDDGAHVLHIAASTDNLTVVKYLIETNPQLLQQPDNNGWTVLHSAAGTGSVPMMMTLIAAGMDITARTNDGAHVLHVAASNDNLTVVKYLIETNPQLLQQPDNKGWTTAHYAASRGSVTMMKIMMMAGLDITAGDNDGDHVLMIAAANNNLAVVRFVIETYPQLLQQPDKNGLTALHAAAERSNVLIVEALIAAGLDFSARTNDGSNVLHHAVKENNLTVAKYLIETSPPLLLQSDNNGWTVAHYAAMGSSVLMLKTLIQAGLDTTIRANDGAQVLHIAVKNDSHTLVKYLIEVNPQLLQHTDNNGWTAAHYAASRGSVPMMETLIEAGIDITARTSNGAQVLHIAANNDNLTVVKYLIETHPQLLQQPDNNGWTAAHYAAERSGVPMMETLIAAGTDITARTNNGDEVLHIAASHNNLPVVKYLIEINPSGLKQSDTL